MPPKEQEKIISTLCVAIASGRYDRKKLTELVNLDFQKGGQFMDVLSAMVVTPRSTEKQIVAKIMAHEESHYTPEQLPLFHAEVKRVYTESKLTLER